MKKIIKQGEMLSSPWYGVAYAEAGPNGFYYVLYPLGINLIVGLYVMFYLWLRSPFIKRRPTFWK